VANLLKVGGTIVKGIQPENGAQFSMEELYKLLECTFVELLRLKHKPGLVLAIDENGHGIRELNLGATIFARYQEAIAPDDAIFGDALVLASREIQSSQPPDDKGTVL
jgi:hypothetical protein